MKKTLSLVIALVMATAPMTGHAATVDDTVTGIEISVPPDETIIEKEAGDTVTFPDGTGLQIKAVTTYRGSYAYKGTGLKPKKDLDAKTSVTLTGAPDGKMYSRVIKASYELTGEDPDAHTAGFKLVLSLNTKKARSAGLKKHIRALKDKLKEMNENAETYTVSVVPIQLDARKIKIKVKGTETGDPEDIRFTNVRYKISGDKWKKLKEGRDFEMTTETVEMDGYSETTVCISGIGNYAGTVPVWAYAYARPRPLY